MEGESLYQFNHTALLKPVDIITPGRRTDLKEIYDKVLELALESQPVPLPEEESVAATVAADAVPVAPLQGSVKH